MSPKTGLNDKENDMKTKDQLSNTNEEANQNSTVDPIRLDNELKFKLNFDIRNELISILNNYTSLFYDDKKKENVIEKANEFIYNFVDLPLKIDQIKENVNNSSNNLLKPTLIINSKMKTEITDLLIKNKNYFILSNNKDIKSYLINENNNLVIKLIQLPFQMLEEDNSINNDYVWKRISINEFNYTADNHLITKLEFEKEILDLKENFLALKKNQLIAKSESDKSLSNYEKEILELKEKISILEDQLVAKLKSDKESSNYKKETLELKENISNLNAFSAKRKESVNHFLEIPNIFDLLIQRTNKLSTLPFECLDLDFMVNVKFSNNNCIFELELINKLKINEKVKANCELTLINNNFKPDGKNMSLNFDLVYIQNKSFQTYKYVNKDILISKFIFFHNRALKVQVYLTAELIKLED